MKNTIKTSLMSLAVISLLGLSGCGSSDNNTDTHDTNTHEVSDEVIAAQRAALAASLHGDEGAQSPRDIDSKAGSNTKLAVTADPYTSMNLCNIHFHKSAEHKGGEFTHYAGNGDGEGYGTGYEYSGTLTAAELAHYEIADDHNPLYAGDTIEVHYVYSSDDIVPGPTLGSCLAADRTDGQPFLRVETQVYVLVNDEHALDFTTLNTVTHDNDLYQAANIPNNTGIPVEYEGSTTGPGYNEEVSPLQVSWSVRSEIAKVNIATVEDWFHHDGSDTFDEHHAHAVRNLVINPALLSEIH